MNYIKPASASTKDGMFVIKPWLELNLKKYRWYASNKKL
jgi:hypothetical protein